MDMSHRKQSLLVKAGNLLISVPALRKAAWKWSYNDFSRKDRGTSWDFLNYGYLGGDDEPAPLLEAEDERNRYCIQLYHLISRFVDLEGKVVLEVGCGRGGGLAYLAKYLKPKLITGVDIAENAIGYCKQTHRAENCSFRLGEAEHLPFEDATFDVVLNVESSHCYPSVERFFHDVARVLRDDGVFFWADLNAARNDDKRISNVGCSTLPPTLTMTYEEDITKKVVKAMDLMNDDRERALLSMFPKVMREVTLENFGIKGSEFYDDMVTGKIVYLMRVYRKSRAS